MGEAELLLQVPVVSRSWNRTFPSCATVICGLGLEMKNLHSLKVHQ